MEPYTVFFGISSLACYKYFDRNVLAARVYDNAFFKSVTVVTIMQIIHRLFIFCSFLIFPASRSTVQEGRL